MAHMNATKKAILAPQIKAVLKKYNTKGSIAVRNYSTLVVNLREGSVDFVGDMTDCGAEYYYSLAETNVGSVCEYWLADHFKDNTLNFVRELCEAMNNSPTISNHDKSDYQTDYYDVGWYIDIRVGKDSKPYVVTC